MTNQKITKIWQNEIRDRYSTLVPKYNLFYRIDSCKMSFESKHWTWRKSSKKKNF